MITNDKACRSALDRDPCVVYIHEVLRRYLPDEEAATRPQEDQALLLEPTKRLANRGMTRVQLIRDLLLDNVLPELEATIHNRLSDRLIGNLGERLALSRL